MRSESSVLGELFESFEDSWRHFLGRTEPLEDFFVDFAEDEQATLEGWLVEPPEEVKAAARPIRESLSRLRSLFLVPDHFLHVWIGLGERIGRAHEGWRDLEAFPIDYERINCFHAAVVVEVAGPIRRLVEGTPNDLPTFLPHMTLAVMREPVSPGPLRERLLPLRGAVVGRQVVRDVKRVRFPAGRRTLFRPWSVEDIVPLR